MKVVGITAIAVVLGLAVVKDVLWPQNYNTISVVGQGRMAVAPDSALVNFGITTIREDAPDTAIQKTAGVIASIETTLDALGIPKENRQMTGYVLNPRYQDVPAMNPGDAMQPPKIDGYTAGQQITVLIPGIAENENRINEVVSAVTKAGANQVGEVKMVATNAETLKQEARVKALRDAKKKAGEMADVLGVRLGGVSNWYESILSAPGSPETSTVVGNMQMGTTPQYVPSGIVVLQPGQLEIVMELTVNYFVEE